MMQALAKQERSYLYVTAVSLRACFNYREYTGVLCMGEHWERECLFFFTSLRLVESHKHVILSQVVDVGDVMQLFQWVSVAGVQTASRGE